MFKKVLALVTILCLLLTFAVGCGQKEEPKAEVPSDTEQTGGSENPAVEEPLHVGYVCNFMSHEWYQNVTRGAQRRAEEMGIKLEVADANLDSAQQISFAENYIAMGVDVLVLTPVDATALGPVIKLAQDAGIQVITESNPVGGESTTVGADNKESGKKAGLWMGEYAKENNMDLKMLIVGFPNFEDCRLRVEGFKEGLEESEANYEILQEVDSQGDKERALSVSTDALTANPEVNAIFGINDDSTQGAIQAYMSSGLDMDNLVAVGYGLEGVVGREALLNDTPVKAELAMFPDFVGASIIDAAIKVFNGETVGERYWTPTTMVTPDTYADFYDQEGDDWVMNFKAIEDLMK